MHMKNGHFPVRLIGEMRTCLRTVVVAISIILLFKPGMLWAAQKFESIQNLHAAATSFLHTSFKSGQSEIKFGQLDPRLRLAKCSAPLEAYWPSSNAPRRNMAVGIRCSGSRPWKVYLPVTIKHFSHVYVTRTALPRGHQISKSDLVKAKRDIHALTDYASSPEMLIGKILKRPLGMGTVIRLSSLSAPKLVKRGDVVTIIARSGAIAINVMGKALMDGRKGDRIQVRNNSSKRVVQATVTASGRVEIPL